MTRIPLALFAVYLSALAPGGAELAADRTPPANLPPPKHKLNRSALPPPNHKPVSQVLAERNEALRIREKSRLQADAAKLFAELRNRPTPTVTPCAAPKIESIFPLSNFTPGGTVLITGCGFGTAPGSLVLSLATGHDVHFTNVQWTHAGIAGTLPGMENGILAASKTQPATLLVTTTKGSDRSSQVTYRAGRHVQAYPFSRVSRVVSDEATENSCESNGGNPDVTVGVCSHYLGVWRWDNVLSGMDMFTVVLKNGWTIDHWLFTAGGCCINRNDLPDLTGQGLSRATNRIEWHDFCHYDCNAFYYVEVFVEGEIGTLAW